MIGHALFEPSPIDRSDAVFTLRASFALNAMFVRMLTGRYFADAERARTRLLRWRAERRAARAALQEPIHENEPALV